MGEEDNNSAKEIKKLKASRGQCRATITRIEKFMKTGPFNIENLQVRQAALQQALLKYQDHAAELEALDVKPEEDDNTEDRVWALLAAIEEEVRKIPKSLTPNTGNQTPEIKLANLPALDIPLFDGRDISTYRPFIEMFEAIVHHDARIPAIQKLCFLKKYLRGEPLNIIDSLPIISASYESALELLKKRYDNPALIVNNHIHILLDIQTLQRGTAQQLRELVSKVRQQITALQNLKQPVSSWDAILTCILLRKLDTFTARLYHQERDNMEEHSVSCLLSFLERRAAVLEASPTASETVHSKQRVVTHVTVASNNNKCIACSEPHKLYKCPKFQLMSHASRQDLVTNNSLCKICLGAHSKKCRYNFRCTQCNSKAHSSFLHPPGSQPAKHESSNTDSQKPQGQTSDDSSLKVNLHTLNSMTNVLLPTAKVLVSDVHNNKHVVRALLDCGSQTSFCTTALATKLGLPQFDSYKNIITLGDDSSQTKKGVKLTVHSMVQDYKLDVNCSIIDKITTTLPQQAFDLNKFQLPKSITLADNEFHIPGEISLLLAADIFFRIVQDGKVEASPEDPILLNTRLGYVVSGSISVSPLCNFNTVTMHAVVSPELDSCVRQFWEAEKVPEVYPESVPEHEYSEEVFQKTVTYKNNQFQVSFPLKVDFESINSSNSFVIALQRLQHLEKRFAREPEFHNLYKKFIQDYLDLGHAKVIDANKCQPEEQPKFFLPHHAVLRPEKTSNKLRVVFDGSAKTRDGHCLNDLLCNGPVVQNSLFDVILLFRSFKYTVQCDVRHMYRMVLMHPEHRRLQNILWREDGMLQCLQLQTVTYGLKSSAYLATRCLVELAKQHQAEFPLASEAILNNSYVDDIQGGSDTLQGAIKLKNELISLMRLGGFDLHKWVSNSPQTLQDIDKERLGLANKDIDQNKSIIKILGLSYDARDDVFRMCGRAVTSPEVPTKRNVLSAVSRLYDPMGFAGPITVKAKLILQQIWEQNLDWDTPLPSQLLKVWNSFHQNLLNMSDLNIARHIQISEAQQVQLIGYCDSSSTSYGCCIFLKASISGKTYIHLLCSKSRLISLASKLTIPKAELNGALLLAKLMAHVASILKITNIYLFCDSQIVLAWLVTATMKVPAYIGNRVKQINNLTQNMSWTYTPSLLNPADILSRGADPQDVVNCKLWLQGPDYLLESDNYNFHLSEIEKPMSSCIEIKKDISLHVKTDSEVVDPFFERFSSLFKMTRVMTYIMRFINACKGKAINKGMISVHEYRESLLSIIKGVQHHYFSDELKCIAKGQDIKSNLKALTPFVDAKGIIRVGGRLNKATNLSFSKRNPIILPKRCHVTRLIITQQHLMLMHGGLKLLLSSLCQQYYIVNSIREIKSVIHKCISCCRHKALASQQLMGSLPNERITPSRAFEKVGLDYCGPFEIKQSSLRRTIVSKGYVAVFVCFASKAVSMEVVSDMSTDTFLAALKRFVSRRGNPTHIYCDNASTFHGANRKLKDLSDQQHKANALGNEMKPDDFQSAVNNYALQRNIQFHFIPKYSPNHGGLWEAAVKAAKFHLKRILPRTFTYEQFNTIIIEIEGILNSRPLTPLSHDTSDFSYLTPGHFIIGAPITSFPHPDITEVPSNRLRFWRSCEQVRQHFWKAWSKDYLSNLNQRTKWQKTFPNLKVGMLVLLREINSPPLAWPMGRISKVYYGTDNKVRTVEVQTSDKKLHSRSISKIIVLPIED